VIIYLFNNRRVQRERLKSFGWAPFQKCTFTQICILNVIPVKTGIQRFSHTWTPASAGVTTFPFATPVRTRRQPSVFHRPEENTNRTSIMNRSQLKTLTVAIFTLFFLFYGVAGRCADVQSEMQRFVDDEYSYFFHYPATWKLRKLPEGGANKDIRFMLQGPSGSSFVVAVEKSQRSFTKQEFESNPGRQALVDQMMQQTIEQVYKSISKNIKATGMKVGDRRDLSSETGAKFYISTLHTLKTGQTIIVAGIHAVPFSKDHMINFIMTTAWDESAKKDNELLTDVFNSFRLIGEDRSSETGSKP